MAKNKTGKYLKYAIGEILLVVIGILIALQINNWNERKQNKVKVDNLLRKILQDIEIDLIARWIDEGAKWEKHWAYIPPEKGIPLPEVTQSDWPRNDIDHFILARLEKE